MTSPRSLPTSLCCLPLLPVSSLKVVGALDNYSLVFVIFINFLRQLKDWVGQVLFLVSCPKGQVEKYVNVEVCYIPSFSSFDQAVSEKRIKMWKVNSKSSHGLSGRWANKILTSIVLLGLQTPNLPGPLANRCAYNG